MIVRAGVVGLLLATIIACSPACTTAVPAESEVIARGLFMCSCGETYMIIYQAGEFTITQVDIGGTEQDHQEHEFRPMSPLERSI